MAQETGIGDFAIQFAKDCAKAEKELKIEARVKVFICTKDKAGNEETLYSYDFRKEDLHRWRWVVEWRKAKFICENPRRSIYDVISFYDKHSGEDYGFGSCLSQLVALKGKITRQERELQRYIAANQSNLFFDEENDPQIIKIKSKLKRAKDNVAIAEERLQRRVELYQKGQQ